jgi:multiple sugar transport system permease protein
MLHGTHLGIFGEYIAVPDKLSAQLETTITTPPQRLGDRWYRFQAKVLPYIFVAPTMLIFTTFVFIPISYAAYISFFDWNGISTPEFNGIRNYTRLIEDPLFWLCFRNTVMYMAGVVPFSMLFGLLAALGLNRKNLPGRAFLRSVYFLPFVISAVATGTTAGWLFGDTFGVINKILKELGFERIQWLTSSKTALPTLIAVTVWIRLGFCMLVYLAGLQSIPTELTDAARVDGASPAQQFFRITLPLLKPTTFLILILNVIYSFEAFDLGFVLTGGGPGYATTVLTIYIYNSAFQIQSFGYASAIGIVFMLVIMIFTFFQWRFTNEGGRI